MSFIIEETFVKLGGDALTMGALILGVVALSTMILEIVGPMAVKQSLMAANECPACSDDSDSHEITPLDVSDNRPYSRLDDDMVNSETDGETKD